jgi:hypothetical protein
MKNVWVMGWVLALGVAGAAQARQQAAPPSLTAASRAVLASGVSVDLLGVSEESGPGALWWTIDGKPLPRPPVPVAVGRGAGTLNARGTRTLLLLVRLSAAGGGDTVPTLRQVTADWDRGARLSPALFGIAAVRRAPGVSLVRFGVPDDARVGVFRLGVALVGDRIETAEFKSVSLRPAPR